jgi:SAM-dependent methyltransferase
MSEGRKHDHGPSHSHEHHGGRHEHKTRFHDPEHAAEFDRRRSEIRADLAEKLAEMLELGSEESVLEVATGTGRAARPVAKRLHGGRIVGIDQAPAMLDVGRRHEEPIPAYTQCAGEADALPFKANAFDRAFVSFSLHHFGNPERVVREVLRVLRNGGRFVILDPVLKESTDALGAALDAKVNEVFRRTHGEEFRFHTASGIQRLLLKAGYRAVRAKVVTYTFDQEGMDGIPTGAHWLEVASELEAQAPELAERLKATYFTWHKHGDALHVSGSFPYALVSGEKPQ